MNDRSLALSLKNHTKPVLNVAGSRTLASSVLLSILVLILLSFPSNMVGQSPPPKWKQGDVFLGVGGGTWKVYRPSINAIVDTMSDGVTSPGANNGSALDNTWHLIGTDSGSSSNVSKIVRFRISPHDPNNSTAVSDVLSVINGSTGTNSKNPQSVTVASSGNIILANANPATIAIFGPSGSFINSFPLANRFVDRALASTDLSSDGSVLFYTSGGANIEKLQLSGAGAGTITNFATLTGQKLFGIKVVPICSPSLSPGCPSGSGILVAAQSTVFLLDGTSGAIVKQYAITGQNNLKVLSLDPLVQDTSGNKQVSDFFWVGSPTSANFYRVSFSTGVASSPLASGASGVFSLATYASFSANQPIPTVFPQATVGSSPPTSAVYVYTDNHPNSTNFDQLTLTGYGTAFTTTVSVFASSVQPASGFSDDGLPCTPTVDGLCTTWEIDADPPLPSGALMGMKIFSTGTAAPPDALLKQTLVLRNEREDVTTGIRNLDPISASRFSVYSLNNRGGTGGETDEGCAYFPPVVEGATLNNPGNVTFRFQCTGLPGAQLATLSPRISVVQLFSGAAPQPFFPGITTLTGGTCCTIAKYRYDATSNTWVINVSFSSVTSTSTFIATTFDDNHIASAFDVSFTVVK